MIGVFKMLITQYIALVVIFSIGATVVNEAVRLNNNKTTELQEEQTLWTQYLFEVLDDFDQWNQCVETKEAAIGLIAEIDDMCYTLFKNHITINITKDEFNRLSIGQTKAFIQQLIDQIRLDVQRFV